MVWAHEHPGDRAEYQGPGAGCTGENRGACAFRGRTARGARTSPGRAGHSHMASAKRCITRTRASSTRSTTGKRSWCACGGIGNCGSFAGYRGAVPACCVQHSTGLGAVPDPGESRSTQHRAASPQRQILRLRRRPPAGEGCAYRARSPGALLSSMNFTLLGQHGKHGYLLLVCALRMWTGLGLPGLNHVKPARDTAAHPVHVSRFRSSWST